SAREVLIRLTAVGTARCSRCSTCRRVLAVWRAADRAVALPVMARNTLRRKHFMTFSLPRRRRSLSITPARAHLSRSRLSFSAELIALPKKKEQGIEKNLGQAEVPRRKVQKASLLGRFRQRSDPDAARGQVRRESQEIEKKSPSRCGAGSAASCRCDALRREFARVALHRAAGQRCEHDANGFARRVGPAERAR